MDKIKNNSGQILFKQKQSPQFFIWSKSCETRNHAYNFLLFDLKISSMYPHV
jgi:hypothetical protein